MDAATAISGCGPAFFALVVEALTDAGVQGGPDARQAAQLALTTMAGTAELLRAAGDAVVAAARGDLPGRRDRRRAGGARGVQACAPRSAPRSRRSSSKARGAARDERDELLAAAIGRADIADYVDALFLVYLILIFVRILLSWIPRIPYNPILSAVDRLHPRRDRPVPEPLPAHPAAGRRRRLRARPEPDHRDHRAAHRARDRRAALIEAVAAGRTRAAAPGASGVGGRWRWPESWSRSTRSTKQIAIAARRARATRSSSIFGFELSNVRNDGVAFGLLGGGGDAVVLALTLGALAPAGRLLRRCTPTRPGPVAGGRAGGRAARSATWPTASRIGAAIDFLDPPAVAGVQPRRRRDRRRRRRCCAR